jgi:DNA (cytosine-5)-methyltransferase 1
LGGKLLGWRTVCAVELDPHCREVLLARQREGHLEPFPIWDDIRTFDGTPWRGTVDVVSGGFPCQDISSAGSRKGLAGDRSGLLFEMLRIVEEVRPRFVFAENSPHLRTRGLGTIIERLAGLGYDTRWGVLGARHAGANHRRDRMWILSHTNVQEVRKQRAGGAVEGIPWVRQKEARVSGVDGTTPNVANAMCDRLEGGGQAQTTHLQGGWWSSEPDVGRVAYGVANRVDRIRATGNGQVPAVAALAWRVLR